MTTGQYPRRRETDAEAQERNDRAENLRAARRALAFRVPLPFRELVSYLTASGRLVRR